MVFDRIRRLFGGKRVEEKKVHVHELLLKAFEGNEAALSILRDARETVERFGTDIHREDFYGMYVTYPEHMEEEVIKRSRDVMKEMLKDLAELSFRTKSSLVEGKSNKGYILGILARYRKVYEELQKLTGKGEHTE